MRYLTLAEVLDLHHRVVEQSGGAEGVRDLGSVESAVAQPQLTFGGEELFADIDEAEAIILALADSTLSREELLDWVTSHVQRMPT